MDEKNKTRTLHFRAKENPNMEKALLDWPIVLQYDVKAISRKFFGREVFSTERSLNQPKVRLYPFDKPIKSLYFRSFQGSKFKFEFGSTCATRCKFLGALPKF